jgi:hypothetical protein
MRSNASQMSVSQIASGSSILASRSREPLRLYVYLRLPRRLNSEA